MNERFVYCSADSMAAVMMLARSASSSVMSIFDHAFASARITGSAAGGVTTVTVRRIYIALVARVNTVSVVAWLVLVTIFMKRRPAVISRLAMGTYLLALVVTV